MRDVRSVLEVIVVRQVIVPLLILPIVLLSSLSAVASQVVLIEAMMPPAVLAVVYASWFGFNSQKAATTVTVGTLLLLPELPVILSLLGGK
jgi:predicted permease